MPHDATEPKLFDPVAFGVQIATLRKARGLPQDKLAEAVGISRPHLQNIESGLSDRTKRTPLNPRLDTLLRLCQALDAKVVIDLSHPIGMVIQFEPGINATERL
ncbi:MAG: helix-turn-helix domain-containing protein [Jatrophihabitans sp.]